MSAFVSASEFTAILRRVAANQFGGKPLFFWPGAPDHLRATLSSVPEVTLAWLDVSRLAEDVIPRRARETLRRALQARLQEAILAGHPALIVENPHLLLRYEPSAPLAIFWDTFVNSARAVVVVIPRPTPRPPDLPAYVQFRGDAFRQLLADSAEGACIVAPNGGVG